MISYAYRYRFLLIFILAWLAFSCTEEKEEGGLLTIDVVAAFDSPARPKSSDFFNNIEYVRVETSEQTIARSMDAAYIFNDSLLLVEGFRKIALFERATGKFVREIGHYGQDPNAYRATLKYYGIDSRNNSTFTMGLKDNFAEYSLMSGEIIGDVKKPRPDDYKPSESEMILGSFTRLDDEHFIGFTKNFNGKQKTRLVIFKRNGDIIKTYPNFLSYVDDPGMFVSLGPQEGSFFKNQGTVFFKEYFNDTTYRVGLDEFTPVYTFGLGKKSPPYAQRESLSYEERMEYMFIRNILDVGEYLFFQVSFRNEQYAAVYVKASGKTSVAQSDPPLAEGRHGIENDLDGFVSIYPTAVYDNLVVGVTPAEEAHAWFKNNPDKISSLPAQLQAFRDIGPEDNPIVTIARLK